MNAAEIPSAAERGVALPGQHFKRSPTLLFDILAESDKDKQQRKLQRATLPTAEPQRQTRSQLQEQQQPSVPQPIPKHQEQQLHQRNPVKRAPGPPTPDLPEALPATRSGVGAALGVDVGKSVSSGVGVPSVAGETQVDEDEGEVDGLPEEASGKRQHQRHQKRRYHQQQRALQSSSGGAIAATAVAASAGVGAAAIAGSVGVEHDTAAATDGGATALIGVVPGGPDVRDLLADFTPRVILQELLGDLFIPPEKLVVQGTFGRGAFATVQSCGLEVAPGGPSLSVAVKSLNPDVLSDLEDLRRFLLEANLLRKLHHPNIVSIHGLGARGLTSLECLRNSAYVVMEALQGGDLRMMVLRQMTSRSPVYSRLDALRWCTHIAAACAYLHETCRPMVIHRDLKLENVMLTGGPVDGRVAKITDFGLHKRARYSRTEDVLIAITNEWSTRAGSVYCRDGNGATSVSVTGGGMYGGAGSSVKGGGTVRGGNARADVSTYAGSTVDASYYGGNDFRDLSAHWSAATAAMAAGSNGNCNGNRSNHQGVHGNRSTSAHYVALATAGLAAAKSERTSTTANGTDNGPAGGESIVVNSLTHRVTSNKLMAPSRGDGNNSGLHGSIEGITEVTGLVSEAAAAAGLAEAGGSTGPGDSLPPGESLRAGSEAAAELGIATTGGPHGKITERERPYLLAYDKRYDGGSKWSSSQDLIGISDAAAAAAAAAKARVVPPSPPLPASPSGGSSHFRQQPQPHSHSQLQQLVGWTPPNVVPPASLEESVHRKMLALMALESAAATAAAPTAAVGPAATAAAWVGEAAADTANTLEAPEVPFSVTKFVCAAAAAMQPEAGTSGPSALMLMRSMSLALQQQREQQQQQLPSPPLSSVASTTAGATAMSGQTTANIRAAARAAAMKTVPENNRMSMDVGSQKAVPPRGGGSAAAAAGAAAGGEIPGHATAPSATSIGKRHAEASRRREKVVSAAARMADATRQVGSLIYMAPELVLSGNYNEKVDVFSFAIIAYELFTGKLLAMKIANDYAFQLEQEGGSAGAAAARGLRTGPGGLPVGGTRSAEEDAQEGVMAYVMRRCRGAREPLPGWWPSELRELISRCWAQDPADRPSFSQIHREFRRMQQSGTLVDMDTRDPLRQVGCGMCTIS